MRLSSSRWLSVLLTALLLAPAAAAPVHAAQPALNLAPSAIELASVDTTPPVTTVVGIPAGWSRSNIMFSLEATDAAGSGVAETFYSVNSSAPSAIDVGTEVTLSEEGIHSVCFWSIDASGNAETTRCVTARIDKTAPVVSSDAQALYSSMATITVTAADALSGVAGFAIRLDGEPLVGNVVRVDQPGRYTIDYFAEDLAGNTATGSWTFRVLDPMAPVIEVAGSNRYATAVEASKLAFPDGASTVIIATGRNWPDALGGTALAGAVDAPILLVDGDKVPAAVMDEIVRLKATYAIILGGPAAVGPAVEAVLKEKLDVDRIAGENRYETADAVALRVIEELGPHFEGRVFLATGQNFPDALAAAPVAAAKGWPLFLSHPTEGILPGTRQAMVDVEYVAILGGTAVIDEAVEEELQDGLGDEYVQRISGGDRYETAVKVAQFATAHLGLDWNRVGITTGQDFPDALAGGVVQGKAGSVMLLTKPGHLEEMPAAVLHANATDIWAVTYFGGPAAITPAVREAVDVLLGR